VFNDKNLASKIAFLADWVKHSDHQSIESEQVSSRHIRKSMPDDVKSSKNIDLPWQASRTK